MFTLHDRGLRLNAGPFEHAVRLSFREGRAWRKMALRAVGGVIRAEGPGVWAELRLAPGGDDAGNVAFELRFESEFPTRLQLAVELPGGEGEPFHLIPGVIHGDNNLARAEPGHFPNLTTSHADSPSCSPYWELRADRASHPVSMLIAGRRLAAVSIEPYAKGTPLAPPTRDGFIRNGLFARLSHDNLPDACGATLGYGNLPRTFLNKDQWLDPTSHLARAAATRGRIFLRHAASRLEAHAVVRAVYGDLHRVTTPALSHRGALTALTDAFVHVNYMHDDGLPERPGTTGMERVPITASPFLGGRLVRNNFTNMRCIDEARRHLLPWRTLSEVGWTGTGVIAYPLLAAAKVLRNDAATRPLAEKALRLAKRTLENAADAINPDSGLLFDVSSPSDGKRLNWWWSGYLVKDCHCAYTNGSGVYYLLKSLLLLRGAFGADEPRWLATAARVLDTIVSLQRPDGNFGFTYRADRPAMLDEHGFAGAWFIPALVLAHRATGERRYLESAMRGAEFYAGFVHDLSCWGTPMDTWKSPDQEGNLAFLRGARLLHETTGDDRHLAMLADAAGYEYLWRYAFRARPEHAPLKDSPWDSTGGSITSVSNPHIHPMGVYIADDLLHLARHTGDAHHADRAHDGNRWGVGSVALYPEHTGYGSPGVLTERFCPSDGLTVETFPDGSPSSLWFSYNGWAAAAVLEGLAETDA